MQDTEKRKNPSNHAVGRDSKGRFVKGYTPNPTGKNGGRNPINELYDALENAQKKHDRSFLEHFVERAYKNDTVAIALAKKLLPDKQNIDDNRELQKVINIIQYGQEKRNNNTSTSVPADRVGLTNSPKSS